MFEREGYLGVISVPARLCEPTNSDSSSRGANNFSVVVEGCMNLADPISSPVATNALTDGWSYFSDLQWTNYRSRFYRLSVP